MRFYYRFPTAAYGYAPCYAAGLPVSGVICGKVEIMVEPALNCFARGCYRFRNMTCTESETDTIYSPVGK